MDHKPNLGRALVTLLSPILLGSLASAQSVSFEAPFRVRDGQGFVDSDVGHAAPLVADVDGDGLPDLLVGQFGEGKLRIHKNLGSAKAPRFEGYTWFQAAEQVGRVPSG